METFLDRYRNLIVLVAVLFVQVLALAVQVKRPTESGSVRLLRLWTVGAISPVEKVFVGSQNLVRNTWRNYFYLRNVRAENQQLKDEMARMRLDQVRLVEDAQQARRLQALLAFKEQVISQTMAAQVIGTSGSEQSRLLYIDKGSKDSLKPDMAVITPEGVVGKIKDVFATTSQVLVINDQSSGVGAILEKSRLQGILKGTPAGETLLHYIMSDEKVEPGERVLTSGGDRIFPKGLALGTVTNVAAGSDLFLNIRVKPAAHVSRLEEVLVITGITSQMSAGANLEPPKRASEILAERLPFVPPKPPDAQKAAGTPGAALAGAAAPPKKPANPAFPERGAKLATKPVAQNIPSEAPAETPAKDNPR